MDEIEIAVETCVRLRRWSDLETAVATYARLLGGADPTLILSSAMLRPVARDALTIMDPVRFKEYVRYLQSMIELSHSGAPLHEAVEVIRRSVEHSDSLRAFETLDSTRGVH